MHCFANAGYFCASFIETDLSLSFFLSGYYYIKRSEKITMMMMMMSRTIYPVKLQQKVGFSNNTDKTRILLRGGRRRPRFKGEEGERGGERGGEGERGEEGEGEEGERGDERGEEAAREGVSQNANK